MEDYLLMQKQVSEILPKYELLSDIKERNAGLMKQLKSRQEEIGQLKSKNFQLEMSEKEAREKMEEFEDKMQDLEIEL